MLRNGVASRKRNVKCVCVCVCVEEAHLAAGHPDSVVYLRLWSGDVEGALRTATERGELNDHLLAIAPTGETWDYTCSCDTGQTVVVIKDRL